MPSYNHFNNNCKRIVLQFQKINLNLWSATLTFRKRNLIRWSRARFAQKLNYDRMGVVWAGGDGTDRHPIKVKCGVLKYWDAGSSRYSAGWYLWVVTMFWMGSLGWFIKWRGLVFTLIFQEREGEFI